MTNSTAAEHEIVQAAADEAGAMSSACLRMIAADAGAAWAVGRKATAQGKNTFEAALGTLEQLLQRTGGPLFGGTRLSVADCLMYPFWERALLCAGHFSAYDASGSLPMLTQWGEHVRQDPTVRLACPSPDRLLRAVSRTGRLDWFDYETCGVTDVHPQLACLARDGVSK
jgi:glutathione S-transferase